MTASCSNTDLFPMFPSLPDSVELQKANLEGSTASPGGGSNSGGGGGGVSGGGSGSGGPSPVASALPLAQLLSKPGALNALTSLTALSGLTDLLGGLSGGPAGPVQTTGVHRKPGFAPRLRSPGGPSDNKIKNERNKFAPY